MSCIQNEDQTNSAVRTRLIQDDNGELIEEQFMVIDNLRMAVVPLNPNETPDWWRSDGFFTNAAILDTADSPAPTPSPTGQETQTFTLQLTLQLNEEGCVEDVQTYSSDAQPVPPMSSVQPPTTFPALQSPGPSLVVHTSDKSSEDGSDLELHEYEASLPESERLRRREIRRGKRRKIEELQSDNPPPPPTHHRLNRGIIIRDHNAMTTPDPAAPPTIIPEPQSDSHTLAMTAAYEMVTESGDSGVKSPKRKCP